MRLLTCVTESKLQGRAQGRTLLLLYLNAWGEGHFDPLLTPKLKMLGQRIFAQL